VLERPAVNASRISFVLFAVRWAAKKLDLLAAAPQEVRRREIARVARVLRQAMAGLAG